jgi:hypothetical protein
VLYVTVRACDSLNHTALSNYLTCITHSYHKKNHERSTLEHTGTLSFTSDTDLKVWPVILYFIWEFVPTILTMVFVANATGTYNIKSLSNAGIHTLEHYYHRYIQSLSIIVL